MRIDSGGVGIEVEVEGEGHPVVLLHGFPDTHELWGHQIPALVGGGFQVIAPDLRGFGASDRPEKVSGYFLPNVVNDVVAVLDDLGVERAHVVGHDWGAAVGWLLGALAPDRVSKLVAISVGHPSGFAAPDIEQLRKSWYMFFFLNEGGAEAALQANDWQLFRRWGESAPHIEDVIIRMSEPGVLTAGLNYYRANIDPASWGSEPMPLPPIGAPVMAVFGTEDAYLGEAQMLRSKDFVAGEWRYERLDGVGHWVPIEQPERLNDLLLDFLRD